MIKLEKVEQAEVEEFCREIYNGMNKTYRSKINACLWKFFKKSQTISVDEKDTLLKIMCLDFQELKLLKKEIDNRYPEFKKDIVNCLLKNKIEESEETTVKSYLLNKYNKGLDKKLFVRKTKVTVCPYCNRNFINVTDSNNGSQLDHFYNKSKYPIFALSFYNLIPSCGPCNLKKGEQEFEYSPYDSELVDPVFTFKAKSVNFFMDVEEFTIEWGDKTNPIASEREEKLDLLNLYQLHRDVVQEIFWKNEVYSDFYKEKIYENFQIGEIQIERLITGAYTDEKDYGKRPLSKLVTDISREIGLLREKRE